ncbi:hypothetical protein GSI_09532 [Ganoderma sinense ZZ0214-1]|uniref:F-box domain-containing protein n=1 Tax=Ganoderma sinense ZZ0214-1 TaxID=1077348 RepID=A0A2G8S3P5_9APHY|nr:hypothetical protein GSI_09532 [Ganoderma sinense ZZ0214-1]
MRITLLDADSDTLGILPPPPPPAPAPTLPGSPCKLAGNLDLDDGEDHDAAARTAAGFRHEKFVRSYGSEDEVGLTVASDCGWTAQSSEDFVSSPTSWTMHEKILLQVSVVATPKPANTIAGLPRELWKQILTYIDDQRDLFRVARVSRALRTIARDALKRHTFRLETTDAITAFSAALTNRPALASTIQHLYIRCSDSRIPSCLPVAFRALRELRSLSLHVSDPALALACAQRALFNEPLPHLTAFATSLPCTPELLDFVQTHGTIEDLSIADPAIDPAALGPALPLPSLRVLACRVEFLRCFHRSPTLTHLHVTLHVEGALETLARALGPQLVSLQLGLRARARSPAEKSSTTTSTTPRAIDINVGGAWSPADVVARFPHLRFLQLRVLEPPDIQPEARLDADVWSYPIDWMLAPRRPLGARPVSPRPRVVVAFVFDLLLPDSRFQLPPESEIGANAERVLRRCATHVARVLYGRYGRPDTSCVVRGKGEGEGVYVEERCAFGEGYWKEV